MNQSQNKQSSVFSYFKPFLVGGIAGCTAATAIMPIDTWKVRIQVCSEDQGMKHIKNICSHPIDILWHVYDNEGMKGFYRGLGSALLRQVTYTTTRLGLYKSMTDSIKQTHKRDLTFFEKVYSSGISGFVGALVGNPADVSLIRFQADNTLLPEERRNYKNAIDALVRIVKEEGVLTLWRGSAPTLSRAVVITIGQLSTYDQLKELSMKVRKHSHASMGDQIMASIGAGIVTSVLSLPFDNIKTKLQKMKKDVNGEYPYSGVVDCFKKSVEREKFSGLWVGLPVYFSRVAPQSVLILLIQDMLHRLL